MGRSICGSGRRRVGTSERCVGCPENGIGETSHAWKTVLHPAWNVVYCGSELATQDALKVPRSRPWLSIAATPNGGGCASTPTSPAYETPNAMRGVQWGSSVGVDSRDK